MKRLHRSDLYGCSQFDEERNIDFHSVVWIRPAGNVIIDPLPLSDHDQNHLKNLGGAAWIVITNSDHIRAAAAVAQLTEAKVLGPQGESRTFAIPCDRWLSEGDEVVPGLAVLEMQGSKTPGELALVLEHTTVITGDLIRAHAAGAVCLLPDAKLTDTVQALQSVERIVHLPNIEALLVGDGWPIFRDASAVLAELWATCATT